MDLGVKAAPTPHSPPSKGGEETPPAADGVLLTEAVHLSHPKTNAQGLAKLQAFASHPLEKGEQENTTTPAFGHPSSTEEGKQERDVRQIISGIAMHFPDPQTLVGKKCMFVTNLEPRVIKGLESNGMLFAVSTEDGKFSLLEPSADIPEGTKAK